MKSKAPPAKRSSRAAVRRKSSAFCSKGRHEQSEGALNQVRAGGHRGFSQYQTADLAFCTTLSWLPARCLCSAKSPVPLVGWHQGGKSWAPRTMTWTLAARVTSQAARLGSSTARATRGSSSTKCASRHPRDRPSMPTAPVACLL